jgi:hypothetical protein
MKLVAIYLLGWSPLIVWGLFATAMLAVSKNRPGS